MNDAGSVCRLLKGEVAYCASFALLAESYGHSSQRLKR